MEKKYRDGAMALSKEAANAVTEAMSVATAWEKAARTADVVRQIIEKRKNKQCYQADVRDIGEQAARNYEAIIALPAADRLLRIGNRDVVRATFDTVKNAMHARHGRYGTPDDLSAKRIRRDGYQNNRPDWRGKAI